jgi:hypothetical protein
MKTQTITFRVPHIISDQLEYIARQTGIRRSDVVRYLINCSLLMSGQSKRQATEGGDSNERRAS